jgi:hypothetical protein
MNGGFKEDVKIGWAMPLDWPYIHSETHKSLVGMIKPNMVYLETPRGGDLAEKREAQCKAAVEEKCTYVWLADADMVYPRTVLVDLVDAIENHGADMAGVLCYRGYPPYDPLIWSKDGEGLLKPFKDYQFGDLVEAGATGAACLLIRREVFESIPNPWFQIVKTEKTLDGVSTIIKRGEDTYFTRKATQAGFKLKIITAYDVDHIREFGINRSWWLIHNLVGSCSTDKKNINWEMVIALHKKLSDPLWVKREFPEFQEVENV